VERLQEIIQYDESYYVSGKFQQVNAKPFSALLDALTDLCDLLIRAPDRKEYKKRILHFTVTQKRVEDTCPSDSRSGRATWP